MGDITRVYLITGFLGSGKTTFLNRIIDRFPKNKKLTILMNEFGEIGIDGTLIEGDELDMMEISKGSIFCVCVKTDFIKGLYELNTSVEPDVLIIESTGVANPSDLKRDLVLPIFNDRFQFTEQFCMIDAAHFLDALGVYASLEKQIATSTLFIINKTDLASKETIDEIKGNVRQFNPEPIFFETTYADIPLDRILSPEMLSEDFTEGDKKPVLSSDELEDFIDSLLDDPNLEITPPDLLMSVTYQWQGDHLKQIEDMAANLSASVVRAKGFVERDGRVYLFSYVMGDWSLEESNIPKERIQHMNIVVFIGPPESMDDIEETSKSGDWTNLGVFQPMSQDSAKA